MKFQSTVLSILLSASLFPFAAAQIQIINCPGNALCNGIIDAALPSPFSDLILTCSGAGACTANSPTINGFSNGDQVLCNVASACSGFTLTGSVSAGGLLGNVQCATHACTNAALDTIRVQCQGDNACTGLQVSNGRLDCRSFALACNEATAVNSLVLCEQSPAPGGGNAKVCDGVVFLDGNLRCVADNTCDGAVQICRNGNGALPVDTVDCGETIPANQDICRVCLKDDSCGTLRTTPGTLGSCDDDDLTAMCTFLGENTEINTLDFIFTNPNGSCFAPCQAGMPTVPCTLAPSNAPSTSAAPSDFPSASPTAQTMSMGKKGCTPMQFMGGKKGGMSTMVIVTPGGKKGGRRF